MQHLEQIKNILGTTLNLGARQQTLEAQTHLLGNLPELDSMAVISLITAIEDHFNIAIDDDEISASTFSTVESLARFVERKLSE